MYTGDRTFPPLVSNPHMLSQSTSAYTLLLYLIHLTIFNIFPFLYFSHTHASQEKYKQLAMYTELKTCEEGKEYYSFSLKGCIYLSESMPLLMIT